MIDSKKPLVLTIAGSDSSGGAGVQVDVKTAYSLGAEVATVITALTAQNPQKVRLVELVSEEMVEAQFRAVADYCEISAVKIGMIGTASRVELIARLIEEYGITNVVVDPVLAATSGGQLAVDGVVDAIKNSLLPIATVLTPNQDEAEILCGLPKGAIDSKDVAQQCWQQLQGCGLKALLLKGGHAAAWQADGEIVDNLFRREGDIVEYKAKRIEIAEICTHGTGCTLSSAVAAHLALGCGLEDAVGRGVEYVQGLLLAYDSYR